METYWTIQKSFKSAEKRRELADKGQALSDGSYPIENATDLHNAAVLAQSGHGNVAAAKRLIARMAQKLGVANPLEKSIEVVKFRVGGEVVKIDNPRKLIFGWASVAKTGDEWLVDHQGDFMDSTWELEKMAYRHVLHYREGADMHKTRQVARLVESMVFTPEKLEKMGLAPDALPLGWWVGYKVDDPNVWERRDQFTGFSIGGSGTRETV